MVTLPPAGPQPPSARSKWLPGAMLLALAVVLAAAVGWWWSHPPGPETEIRAHHRPLAVLEREPAPRLGRGFERWRMIAAGRDTVTGLWRAAAPGSRSEWIVVILGGIGTDARAALLVPDSLPIGVLAVSWPWQGPRHMTKLKFVANLPAVRRALLRTPGAVARGVEAVRHAEPGTRVVLLGASLGVPPTVGALPLAHPDALVLVDGAADLRRLLGSEVERGFGGGIVSALLATPAAALAARIVSSLEPANFGAVSGGLPVLLIDAERDERYPRDCVTRLHAAFPHATRATHPGGHLRPEHREQLAAIIGTVWRWLPAAKR